jgi:hypothetical protein
LIVSRLEEGFSEDDCINVIKAKKNNVFLIQNGHINIKTFFAADKFEGYVQESNRINNSEEYGIGNYVPED